MAGDDRPPTESAAGACGCFGAPDDYLRPAKYLGMDDNFGESSLLICSNCGQKWLKYLYELEAFTASGRWFLGPVTDEQSLLLTRENARAILAGLGWYYYGGSYFGGKNGVYRGGIAVQRKTVESSNLKSVGYDADKRVLEIEFQTGGVYQYAEVPEEIHTALMKADSHGRYFLDNIKDVYAYRRIN